MEHQHLHYGILGLQNIFVKACSLLVYFLVIPSLPAAFVQRLNYNHHLCCTNNNQITHQSN